MEDKNGHIKWTYEMVHIMTPISKLHFEQSLDARVTKWS